MRFLLRVFDFDKLPDVTSPQRIALLPSWITARGFDKPAFYEKVNAVYRVLESAIVPTPLFDLKIGIKRKTKKNYSIEDIRLAAGICAAIEVLDGELYQVRIEYLSPVSNKAYRILYEAAKPKHLRDILREVNHRITKAHTSAKVSYRSLGLHNDPRFAPVGRSGYWGLSEWENLQTSRIVDIMKEFFYFKKSSATATEICNYVLAKRPDAAEKSILAYLSISKDIFTRVSEKEYELTEWGKKPYISSRTGKPKAQRKNPVMEVVQANIESYLSQQPDCKAPLIKIIKHVVKTTNCKSPAVYNYVGKMPNLRKEKAKDGIYCFLIPKSVPAKPVANSEQQLLTMLKQGESETVELKTAACWNNHARAKDDKMIQNVVETVAAFVNSKKGGTLVIGVMDDGSIIGLVDDYKAADKSKPNRDGYELFLRNSINNNLGGDCLTFYEIRFETLNGVEVCCVAVKPSPKPVYYQGNFLVRNGNQSKKLNPQETVEFLRQRNS
jgi:hypothetical protein